MREAVPAPDGRIWEVRRRWVTRLGHDTLWSRFHGRIRSTLRRAGKVADADPGCAFDLADGLATAAVVLLVILLVLFLAIPLLVAIVDLAVLLLLAGLGGLARIVLRGAWTIEARADDGTVATWLEPGWRASARRRDELEQTLRAGLPVPADHVSFQPPAHDPSPDQPSADDAPER